MPLISKLLQLVALADDVVAFQSMLLNRVKEYYNKEEKTSIFNRASWFVYTRHVERETGKKDRKRKTSLYFKMDNDLPIS